MARWRGRQPLRHHVEDGDASAVSTGERIREPEGKLGVRTTADPDKDPGGLGDRSA